MFPTLTASSGRWTFCFSSGASYAACGVRVFDDTGVWSTRQFPQKITKHIIAQKNPFFHPTMLFRRAVLESVNGYSTSPETRRTEDYDLVMRLAANGVIGENLQEILYSVYEPQEAYLRHNARTRMYEVPRPRARTARDGLPGFGLHLSCQTAHHGVRSARHDALGKAAAVEAAEPRYEKVRNTGSWHSTKAT